MVSRMIEIVQTIEDSPLCLFERDIHKQHIDKEIIQDEPNKDEREEPLDCKR